MPEKASTALEEKAVGALVGSAVGDAIGGAVEGWTPEAIRERHGGWVTGIVGPWYDDWRTARPIAPYHKGDGHITDDTLMTHALVEVYDERRSHLDAYAVAESLVPKMLNGTRWVPELEADALLLQRVFLAEKWLVARLHYGHVDPREAGVGNIVNCGAAMYMAPVGIANAGDPEGAYAEALDVAGAHQSSYGREAAGVFAAAVAAAMIPGATPASAVETALGLAKDGTRRAVEAVAEAVSQGDGVTDWEQDTPWARVLRDKLAARFGGPVRGRTGTDADSQQAVMAALAGAGFTDVSQTVVQYVEQRTVEELIGSLYSAMSPRTVERLQNDGFAADLADALADVGDERRLTGGVTVKIVSAALGTSTGDAARCAVRCSTIGQVRPRR